MFPVFSVNADSEGIRALPGAEAPGRGILREGHVSCAPKKRLVGVVGARRISPLGSVAAVHSHLSPTQKLPD